VHATGNSEDRNGNLAQWPSACHKMGAQLAGFLGHSCRPVRVDASPSNPKTGFHRHGTVQLDGSASKVSNGLRSMRHGCIRCCRPFNAKKSRLGILLNTSPNQQGNRSAF